jgi:GTP cyclohydrolase I
MVTGSSKGHAGAPSAERAQAQVPGVRGAAELEFRDLVRRMLELVGEDPKRDGLAQTPARVSEAMRWLTRGYGMSVEKMIGDAIFEEQHESIRYANITCFRFTGRHMSLTTRMDALLAYQRFRVSSKSSLVDCKFRSD